MRKLLISTLLIFSFISQVSFAEEDKVKTGACVAALSGCAAVLVGPIKNIVKACKPLRKCKKTCRVEKRDCKKLTRQDKRACRKSCKDKKGKERRQCMKSCKETKRAESKACRSDKKVCKEECKTTFKTPECTTARAAIVDEKTLACVSLTACIPKPAKSGE